MRLLHHLDGRIAVWPFDPVPATGMLIVEIYTAIAARAAGLRKGLSKLRDAGSAGRGVGCARLATARRRSRRYDDHSTDAILASAWLRANAERPELWAPAGLTPRDRPHRRLDLRRRLTHWGGAMPV